jgi:hypothetical protein
MKYIPDEQNFKSPHHPPNGGISTTLVKKKRLSIMLTLKPPSIGRGLGRLVFMPKAFLNKVVDIHRCHLQSGTFPAVSGRRIGEYGRGKQFNVL